jgi:hypothetical protein
VVATIFLRGFLAGLWSHTLFSALAGAGVGYLVVRTDRPLPARLAVVGAALFGAWVCHFVWNSPLLADGIGGAGFGVLAVLLVKGIPPLIMILVMVRSARHREADYYVAQLSALDDPEVATGAELHALSTGHLRACARRYAHGRAGIRGRSAVRRLQRAQARLAVELSRLGQPPDMTSPRLARWYRETLRQRRLLVAMGHAEGAAIPHRHGTARAWLVSVSLAVLFVAGAWLGISSLGGA